MKIDHVKILKIDPLSRQKTAHCYFFHKGETIPEQFVNRRSRPHKEYRKLLAKVLEEIPEVRMLWNAGHIKATWSQKCGCSCGCSPGFRLTGLYGRNIYVDVK